MRTAWIALAAVTGSLLAGCANPFAGDETPYVEMEGYVRDTVGENGTHWPDLSGQTLTILDNGAFSSRDEAVRRFENLTGVKVKVEQGGDTGSALKKLGDRRGDGTYDIVYGLDQAYLGKAQRLGLLRPYTPALADRVDRSFLFFGEAGTWPATPVDHGWVAINVDPHYRDRNGTDPFGGETVDSLAKVRKYADLLAVPSPVNSSPGLAFLLVTIATYGENPDYGTPYYDWKAYWRDLLQGTTRRGATQPPCILVTKDWTEAYEQHFSGGYGAPPDGKGLADKPLVVSYTESPAYEIHFGRDPAKAAQLVLEPGSTWHQVQTMAIANGTRNLAAAQAWIEYTLTDHFQGMRADPDGVYPVVAGIDTDAVYGEHDPDPGSFRPAHLDYHRITERLDGWLSDWRKLAEDPKVNCRL
jgi:thiamine transport system substrate-binding protein